MNEITMDKKYQTREGHPVRVLCVDRNHEEYPVVALVPFKCDDCSRVDTFTKSGGYLYDEEDEHQNDLVEITPYADFEIDERVIVNNSCKLLRRYFAGVSQEGNPMTFFEGKTSWSSNGGHTTCWDQCRRPTPKELLS